MDPSLGIRWQDWGEAWTSIFRSPNAQLGLGVTANCFHI